MSWQRASAGSIQLALHTKHLGRISAIASVDSCSASVHPTVLACAFHSADTAAVYWTQKASETPLRQAPAHALPHNTGTELQLLQTANAANKATISAVHVKTGIHRKHEARHTEINVTMYLQQEDTARDSRSGWLSRGAGSALVPPFSIRWGLMGHLAR